MKLSFLRVLRMLREYELLEKMQFGFCIDGSCQEPLHLVNSMYDTANKQQRPLRLAMMDGKAGSLLAGAPIEAPPR